MAKAVLCPVCIGKGLIMDINANSTQPTKTCHGCNGKGWVEVSNEPLTLPDRGQSFFDGNTITWPSQTSMAFY